MKAVAIMNQKGGTGKTTLATHLAMGLHRGGHAARLIDADPQGSASDWMLAVKQKGATTPKVDQVALTQAHQLLRTLESETVVIIDTPGEFRPETQRGTVSILADLSLIIVPMLPGSLDKWGAQPILDALQERRDAGLPTPPVAVCLNKVYRRAKAQPLANQLRGRYGVRVLEHYMSWRPRYLELPELRMTAFDLRKSHGARKEMEDLLVEVSEVLELEAEEAVA